MANIIDVNEGVTGANGVPAAIAGFIGVVFLVIHPLISLLFFSICAVMSKITEGIEFNIETKRYRKYYDLFGMRSGRWTRIPEAVEIGIRLCIKSFRVKRWLPASANDRSSATETIKTFNITLVSGNQENVFYEFYSYKQAQIASKAISTTLNVPIVDYFEKHLEYSESRR